jgi:dipeptidyl aminopeptidase/acylaminoacyl peptidase
VHKGEIGTYVANWRPDGSGLLLIKVRGADALDVLYLDLETEQLDILLQPDEASAYVSFSWTPDGQGFYLATNQDRDFGGLAFYDFKKRELRWIETPNRDVEKVALSRDGRYLAWVENDQGFSELRIRDLETGISERSIGLPRGVINWIKWAPKVQRLAIQLSSATVPGDIWIYDSKSALLTRATTSSLAGLDPRNFIEPVAVSFPSHDGEIIFGLIYLPEHTSTENKLPVILHLHGGPTMQAKPGFEAFLQYLLARGYAILDLNYRGSIGFGKRYMRLDNGQLRLNAIKDIESAVDWLVRTYPVDVSRIAVMGESYGGFMSLASVTTFADKFQAGIVFAGVSNWLTALENAPPQLKASDRAEYGDISNAEDREFLRQLSPITHIDRIKSPLMVVHGASDPRNPVIEADQIVRAIRERGGEVKYLRFPDEGHGIRKLPNRISAYRLAAQFLEQAIGKGIVDC